jgi:hypothetical protein
VLGRVIDDVTKLRYAEGIRGEEERKEWGMRVFYIFKLKFKRL